jgi:hypothetical protein
MLPPERNIFPHMQEKSSQSDEWIDLEGETVVALSTSNIG